MNFYETINDIQYHVKHNVSLYNKHDEFKKQYPKLFQMLCDPSCDQAMLSNLIKLHKQVSNGKVSKKDADVRFGTVAVEKYVQPLVNSTHTQTQDALPKIQSKEWTHI
jgi:hypothetical protein